MEMFEQLFLDWIKTSFKVTRKIPNILIIYREGLTESQAKAQLPNEIEALNRVVEEVSKKTKPVTNVDFNPEIVYVLVNKKINTRFYSENKDQTGGKFQQSVKNPNSGSIIMEESETNPYFNFYLAAQYVTEGTCTPTHYKVIHSNGKMPEEALMMFTYEQCFSYYNWSGAIRVPAPLQSASKLARLAGEHIK